MGIGKSNITQKQWKNYQKQFQQLTTKAQRIEWLANGTVDAMELWDMDKDEAFWVPMINHIRVCDGGEPLRFENRDDALVEAQRIKDEDILKQLAQTTP